MEVGKLPVLPLLAFISLVLALACAGAAAPQSRLSFYVDRSGNSSISITRPDGTGRTDVSASLPWEAFPAWSPDGSRIAFYAVSDLQRDVYIARADGSGAVN